MEKTETAGPKPIHTGHRLRVRNRFEEHGLDSFADHEALELLLFYAQPRRDTNKPAHQLLAACDNRISSVIEAKPDMLSLAGAGQKAVELIGLFPSFEAMYRRDKTDCGMGLKHLSGAEQAKRYTERLLSGCVADQVWVCCMDAKMVVRNCLPLFDGRLDRKKGLRSIISASGLVHSSHLLLLISHADGQPGFFAFETAAIRELNDALKEMGIRLLDVVLYTADGAITLTESGGRLG